MTEAGTAVSSPVLRLGLGVVTVNIIEAPPFDICSTKLRKINGVLFERGSGTVMQSVLFLGHR